MARLLARKAGGRRRETVLFRPVETRLTRRVEGRKTVTVLFWGLVEKFIGDEQRHR